MCLKTLGNNPPEICPNNVLLKIKRFLIEAKYQQQAALMSSPQKNTQDDSWCVSNFPNISVFSKPPVWGDESHGSFLARATFLERGTFSGDRHENQDDRQGEGATWEEFVWRDGIATFFDFIYILDMNIFICIYNICFFWI